MAEYTADELAADSDGEKRLEKAEKAAERKAGLKRRRKQQPAQRGAAQTRTQRYTAAQAYGGYTVPQLYPPSFPQLQQTASGAGQSVRRAGGSAGTMQRVSVGPCFACGEMGHLRMYCPKIQTQEKKWYPSVESVYEYRELYIVSVYEGSVVESGSGDVNTASTAGDKGGNREVTSKPLPFVNAPPEGCVWEQWGDLGVPVGMWEVEAGVSEIEVPKVGVRGSVYLSGER